METRTNALAGTILNINAEALELADIEGRFLTVCALKYNVVTEVTGIGFIFLILNGSIGCIFGS